MQRCRRLGDCSGCECPDSVDNDCHDGAFVDWDHSCHHDHTDYGYETCDTAWNLGGHTCANLEILYNWNCTGCICAGDEDCGGGYDCNGQRFCDDQVDWIGDDLCDNGWAGVSFDCEEFNCDEGDCDCTTTEEDGGFGDFVSGDINSDGQLDVLDIVVIVIEVLILSYEVGSCGFNTMDANGDGDVNVLDIVVFVNAILSGM